MKALRRALCLLLPAVLLAGCGQTASPAAQPQESPSAESAAPAEDTLRYEIRVTDENGEPVADVLLQFCSDSECMTGATDGEGLACFEKEAGAYTVHALKVPEGYAADETEYAVPEPPETLTLVLRTEEAKAADEENTVELPEQGFRLVLPPSFRDSRGSIAFARGWMDDGFARVELQYYAVSEENWEAYNLYYRDYVTAMQNGQEPPAAPDPAWMSGYESAALFEVFSINGGRGEKEIRAILRDGGELESGDFAWFRELGGDGEYRFFAAQFDEAEREEERYREAMGAFYDEFKTLFEDRESFVEALSLRAPAEQKKLSVGDTIAFETSDLDGGAVSSAALFAESKITMINLWATWCGPCRAELPELETLAAEFAAQGCRIVGLCHDADSEEMCELAKSILADSGADYLNLAAPENVDEIFLPSAFPTSYFVDSEGRVLGTVVGAYPEGYRSTLAETLALLG